MILYITFSYSGKPFLQNSFAATLMLFTVELFMLPDIRPSQSPTWGTGGNKSDKLDQQQHYDDFITDHGVCVTTINMTE